MLLRAIMIGAGRKTMLRWDISDRLFIICVAIVVSLYGLAFIVPHHLFLGWQADEWVFFRKGMTVVDDWRNAFTVYHSLNHAFWLLFAKPFLSLGLSLPTVPFPIHGEDAGKFRAFSMAIVLFHLAFAVQWVFFARRLTGSNAAALISLILLLSHPYFVLWVPQADTRWISMPALLLALTLVMKSASSPERINLGVFLSIGLLFGLSQSFYYNTIPLGAATLVLFSLWLLWRGPPRVRSIASIALMALGVAVIPVLLEIMALYAPSINLDAGPDAGQPSSPLAYMFVQLDQHRSHNGLAANGVLEFLYLVQVLGPVLIAFLLLSGAFWFRKIRSGAVHRNSNGISARFIIITAVPMSAVVLLLDGSFPFPRQFIPLFPFLFIATGVAFVELLRRCSNYGWRIGVFILCSCALLAQNVVSSLEIYKTHWALGRTASQARALLPNDRKIIWLVDRARLFHPWTQVTQAHPDDLVFVDHPHTLLTKYPAFLGILSESKPLLSAKRPWGTGLANLEFKNFHGHDFRFTKVLHEVRLYRAGELQAAIAGRRNLHITKITSGSSAKGRDAWRLFDNDASGGPHSSWQPNTAALVRNAKDANTVEIEFGQKELIGRVQIITGYAQFHPCLLDSIEIEARPSVGADWVIVWRGSELSFSPIVDASWPPQNAQALRLKFGGCRSIARGRQPVSAIEEIRFPGFKVNYRGPINGSKPVAKFSFGGYFRDIEPPRSWCRRYFECLENVMDGKILRLLYDMNAVDKLIVYIDGKPVPTDVDPYVSRSIVALLPKGLKPGDHKVYISDHFNQQRSPTAILNIE